MGPPCWKCGYSEATHDPFSAMLYHISGDPVCKKYRRRNPIQFIKDLLRRN